MKKAIQLIGFTLSVVVIVVLVRTFMHTPNESETIHHQASSMPLLEVDNHSVVKHLSESIRFKTISRTVDAVPGADFEKFTQWMKSTYPEVFATLEAQQISKSGEGVSDSKLPEFKQYSLLLKWQGSDANLKPILLSAHYDVVPVPPSTESLWQHPPFDGHVDDEYIWGRGTLDDKSAVIALLESVSSLIKSNAKPQRTVYLSLTHDEELGSPKGATQVTDYLLQQGIEVEWSLDEGSFLLEGFMPGIEPAIASINVAEKGYATAELTVHGKGGHSSMPPPKTTVGVLSEAIYKLQSTQMPGGLNGVSAEMFDVLSRYMSFENRLFFSNQWMFGGLLESKMSKDGFTNALLRTTTAPTMLSAGVKDNILPITAVGIVNFRLHPRNTIEDVLKHIETVVDDERVEVRLKEHHPASKTSSYDTEGFSAIASSARAVYGDIIVTPGITVGGTDSSQYQRVVKNNYRFNPMKIGSEDLSGFHGVNERISIENMKQAVLFYRELIVNSAKMK